MKRWQVVSGVMAISLGAAVGMGGGGGTGPIRGAASAPATRTGERAAMAFRFKDATLLQVMQEMSAKLDVIVVRPPPAGSGAAIEAMKVTVDAGEVDGEGAFNALQGLLLERGYTATWTNKEAMARAQANGAGQKMVIVVASVGEAAKQAGGAKEATTRTGPSRVGMSKTAKFAMHYESEPLENVLSEAAERFGFIYVGPRTPMPGRVTIRADKPCDAEETIGMIDDILVPFGYGEICDTTAGSAEEQLTMMRVVPDSYIGHGPRNKFGKDAAAREAVVAVNVDRLNASRTESVKLIYRGMTLRKVLENIGAKYHVAVVLPKEGLEERVTIKMSEAVHVDRALRLVGSILWEVGYEMEAGNERLVVVRKGASQDGR